MADELVTRNVAMAVKLTGRPKRQRMAWTSDEARAFLDCAAAADDPLAVAYVLILCLGLRKGEVLGLRWRDVNLGESELHIRNQLQRVSGTLHHRETKTEGSTAPLPLPSLCVAALQRQSAAQLRAREAAGPAWQGDDWVVTTRYGTPVEPRNFNRAFTARCTAAGVRLITVHDARRTCASLLVDLDVHPRVVMQILRHAQFAVTMEIYAQASSRATREALMRLGDRLHADGTP
jgi:integrase